VIEKKLGKAEEVKRSRLTLKVSIDGIPKFARV